ncbi:MAG: helix-turn-helix domain-containing protein [Cyanobacteria bacterium P01_D01_bin.105]
MAPRKLSDADKSTIVDLYKQPGQTTSTLAEQYGVSNSTISRILKMSIPSDEYRELVSTKRMGGGTDKASANKRRQTKTDGKPAAKSTSEKGRQRRRRIPSNNDEAVNLISEAAATATDGEFVSDAAARSTVEAPKLKTAAEKEADQENAKPSKRRRRRKTTAQKAVGKNAEQTEQDEQLALLAAEEQISPPPSVEADNDEEDDDDDLLGLDETLGDDFGDDDDELDEEDDDDELDDDEMATPKPKL